MKKYLIPFFFILGNILHIWFFQLNEVLKIADSFAYLQMAHYLQQFSLEWFWNGWFWFLYSIPIALVNVFIHHDMVASFFVNMLLFNVTVFLCYLLWKNYLQPKYNILFVILLFLSPILLNYNIHILSENIYIPLFLILFLSILRYNDRPDFSGSLFLWLLVALLYYTRGEAFIYLWSLGLIIAFLWLTWRLSFGKAVGNYISIILAFCIFIAPYVLYLYSFTWEWWITNKGSSNLRQAELRGISKMDDDGFEQAVGELTPDNKHFIAWFAWGLKYDAPQKGESFKNYLLQNPEKVFERVQENQLKLYSQNLPRLILWNAFSLYWLEWSEIFYKNYLFLAVLILPILFLIYGMIVFIRTQNWYVVFSFLSFFITASLFFTLFFVLDRYFVIFVPLMLFFIVYGIEHIWHTFARWFDILKYIIMSGILIGIFSLGTYSYYNTFQSEDEVYEVKKIAGEWLQNQHPDTELKILERFPVVTYYSWSWERWLTPYTSHLDALLEYAHYNKIDYLVVDSIDFYKYRPDLRFLLDESEIKYEGLEKVHEFEKNNQKVILYKVE